MTTFWGQALRKLHFRWDRRKTRVKLDYLALVLKFGFEGEAITAFI
jgi:hypothetical protein